MSCQKRTQCRRVAQWCRPFPVVVMSATMLVESLAATVKAQEPQPSQAIASYRSPAIALVQPAAGAALAQDKAVLIFRFAPGEAADPLDASSFAVWVNGSVRSASFQVGASEAWGPLVDAREGAPSSGVYQVTARICSTRGACGTTSATVTVAASKVMPTAGAEQGTSRRQRVIDLILAGLRRFIGP